MKYHKPARFKNVARSTTGLSQNASATQRGYNFKWQKYAKQYKRDNPYCVALHCYDCNQIFKKGQAQNCPICRAELRVCGRPTQCVDHIVPVKGPDDPLFWDERNHESMCYGCHSRVTIIYDSGFGRSKKK